MAIKLAALWQSNEILQGLKALIYGVFIFLGIPIEVVSVLAILMLTDTFLGIVKALRFNDKISFKILLWGMITKSAVLIVPMVLALVAKALGFDFIWMVLAVLNILVVSEAFSCITNILSIKSGERLENTDYITALLKAIRRGLATYLKKTLHNIESGENNKEKL